MVLTIKNSITIPKWNQLIRSILNASVLAFFLVSSLACSRADQLSNAKKLSEPIKTSPLNPGAASRLISSNSASLAKTGFISSQLDLQVDQLFSVYFAGKQYSVIPVSRESKQGIAAFTCSLLLFSKNGGLIGGVDTLGSGEVRPWTCDGVLALAFASPYQDGSLGIIVIYEGTAPSSERFKLPVALKANLSHAVFSVDEQKSALLASKNVKTIKAAREIFR